MRIGIQRDRNVCMLYIDFKIYMMLDQIMSHVFNLAFKPAISRGLTPPPFPSTPPLPLSTTPVRPRDMMLFLTSLGSLLKLPSVRMRILGALGRVLVCMRWAPWLDLSASTSVDIVLTVSWSFFNRSVVSLVSQCCRPPQLSCHCLSRYMSRKNAL